MIEVRHLHKRFGAVTAVHDESFDVEGNQVVGFLGPNGAGKTTTLRIIAGFLGATRGRVAINGFDTVDEPMRARSQIGYMPEHVPLYPEMRVVEYLRFRAEVKGIPRANRTKAIERAMSEARVEDHAKVLVGALSRGYRQRVGLADALVARPPVLVLDEPTAGLDPNQIREVRELIRALAQHHTVFLSTHILSEAEATCHRAIVIHDGRVVAHGTIEELRRSGRSSTANFMVRGSEEAVRRVFASLSDVNRFQLMGEPDASESVLRVRVEWSAQCDPDRAIEEATSALVQADLRVRGVAKEKASLDDVFALLTHAPERTHVGEAAS